MRFFKRLTGFLSNRRRPEIQTGPLSSLDKAAIRLSVLSGRPLRPFATRDFGRERNTEARSVVVNPQDAIPLVDELRRELSPGILGFVGCTRSLAEPPDAGSEVVVASGTEQFDALRIMSSDAINYNFESEDLIRKLRAYDAKYGIDIFHAETDTIEFRLLSLPTDLTAFCEDLAEFCPDIVEQGVGTVQALEQDIARTHSVLLWWD